MLTAFEQALADGTEEWGLQGIRSQSLAEVVSHALRGGSGWGTGSSLLLPDQSAL